MRSLLTPIVPAKRPGDAYQLSRRGGKRAKLNTAMLPFRNGFTHRGRCHWCCLRLRTSLASRRRRRCRRRYNIGPLEGRSAPWNQSIAWSIEIVWQLTFVDHVGDLWIILNVKYRLVESVLQVWFCRYLESSRLSKTELSEFQRLPSSIHVAVGVGPRVSWSGVGIGVDDVLNMGVVDRLSIDYT